jgi:pyridinium-3,5-biscarboxylic acid mononucleotide synthase
MDRDQLRLLLGSIRDNRCSIDDAMTQLRDWPIMSSDVAQFDTHRQLRNGFTEVIMGQGKSLTQLEQICAKALAQDHPLLATRIAPAHAVALTAQFPQLQHDDASRTLQCRTSPRTPVPGRLAILAAGTADVPVAEEAWQTAAFFGAEAERHYDIGVAGLHRLLSRVQLLRDVDVAIVVAGMEGALPTVVGGLIAAPIIAVPTSVGYGTQYHGLSALLGMLNSCAEGISVVNIDNGYGSACAALRILQNRMQCTTDNA